MYLLDGMFKQNYFPSFVKILFCMTSFYRRRTGFSVFAGFCWDDGEPLARGWIPNWACKADALHMNTFYWRIKLVPEMFMPHGHIVRRFYILV